MSVNAPSTFLDMVQRLRQEAGAPGTGPTTVLSQAGEYARLVSWTVSAWIDIQSKRPDWGFLRQDASFATVAGQAEYTPVQCGITAGTFKQWDFASEDFRTYVTATGTNSETPMEHLADYDAYRATYLFGANRNTRSRPMIVAQKPVDHSLAMGPVPAAGYTVTGPYFTQPVILAADADQPAIDQADRMIIVWRALMDYGGFKEASTKYQMAKQEHDVIMSRLESRWLRQLQMGGALA